MTRDFCSVTFLLIVSLVYFSQTVSLLWVSRLSLCDLVFFYIFPPPLDRTVGLCMTETSERKKIHVHQLQTQTPVLIFSPCIPAICFCNYRVLYVSGSKPITEAFAALNTGAGVKTSNVNCSSNILYATILLLLQFLYRSSAH